MIATYSHIPVLAPRASELLAPSLGGENTGLGEETLGAGGQKGMFEGDILGPGFLGVES